MSNYEARASIIEHPDGTFTLTLHGASSRLAGRITATLAGSGVRGEGDVDVTFYVQRADSEPGRPRVWPKICLDSPTV